MNPTPREELEAKITALLLGELTAEEAGALRHAVASDASLAELQRRLEHTIALVREAAVTPEPQAPVGEARLQLSPERSERLKVAFKTVAAPVPPRDLSWAVAMSIAAVLIAAIGSVLLLVSTPFLHPRESAVMAGGRSLQLDLNRFGESAASARSRSPISAAPPPPVVALEKQVTARREPTPVPIFGRAGKGMELDQKKAAMSPDGAKIVPRYGIINSPNWSFGGGIGGGGIGGGAGGFGGPAVAEAQMPGSIPNVVPQGPALYSSKPPVREEGLGRAGGKDSLTAWHDFDNDSYFRIFTNAALAEAGQSGSPQITDFAVKVEPEAVVRQEETPKLALSVAGSSEGVPLQETLMDRLPILGDVPAAGRMFRGKALGAQGGTAPTAPQAPVEGLGAVAVAGVVQNTAPTITPAPVEDLGAAMVAGLAQNRGVVQVLDASKEPAPAAAVEGFEYKAKEQLADKANGLAPSAEKAAKLEQVDQLEKHVTRLAEGATRGLNETRNDNSDLMRSKLMGEPRTAPVPQPEIESSANRFSTFSLNVSDVSFKLAAAVLERGQLPDPTTIRSEEFINAFDYHDSEPPPGSPVGFVWEQGHYPFSHDRDILRFAVKTAATGRQPGTALNIVLLLDRSGSMERADRVQIVRQALHVLASRLQPEDQLSIITFARTPRLWADGIQGNESAPVLEEVANSTPEGGTNLEDALNLAYQTALKHQRTHGGNRVLLLTDGAANLGNVDPDALKSKVEAYRKLGVALDCFGIGWEGFDDEVLETLSRNGDGRYRFLNSPEEAATGFAQQLTGAFHPAAADVKVQVEFNPDRVVVYRQIGYAKHQLAKEQFRDNTVDAAELAAAESGNALYVVQVNPSGQGPLGVVRVRYKLPESGEYREQEWPVPYTGQAPALEQATPSLRLAVGASAFSELLAESPYATEITPDSLLSLLNGVVANYAPDTRPQALETMIHQAMSLKH